MSSSLGQHSCTRPFILAILLVLSTLLLFYSYHTNLNVPSFARFFQLNTTLSTTPSNSTLKPEDNPTDNPTDNLTVLLIWTWPFGVKFDSNCSVFGIEKCLLTDDRSLYHTADGVFVHHRDIRADFIDLRKVPRPWFQKWVWMDMESPQNTSPIPILSNLFNITCNYREDSTVRIPYGYLQKRNASKPIVPLPNKDKLVCWVVSNWNNQYARVQYYNELKKYIAINIYGRAFQKPLSADAIEEVVSSCKFYLAFENSVYKDYITEKLFRTMMFGSVPIVLGPPRDNYEKQIPADAFIHINDFANPKELAERLHYLDKHPEEYRDYFRWRAQYEAKLSGFGKEHACKSCSHIRKTRSPEVVSDLTKWIWG